MVYQSLLQYYNQLENINESVKRDNTLISLPITTKLSLFGSVMDYNDIESKVLVTKGVVNQLKFDVTDQDGNSVNVGKVLLECYLL